MSEAADVWLDYPAGAEGWRARVYLPRIPVAGDWITVDETWPAEAKPEGEWPEAMIGQTYRVKHVEFGVHEPGNSVLTTPVAILGTP
jgi:hypothetical protein